MMTAFYSLLSLMALLYLVLGPYNGFRVDRVRQDLFEIRDALFRAAASGEVSFNSHAYIATRTMLNGMIRFAHRMSLSRIFVGRFFIRAEDIAIAAATIDREFSASSKEDRDLCTPYVANANRAVAFHLITSPFMFVLVVPLFAVLVRRLGTYVASKLVELLRRQFAVFDRVAFMEGQHQVGSLGTGFANSVS